MQKFTLFLVALCFCQLSFAQVTIEKNKLYKHGQKYKMKDYEQVFQNEEAKTYFKKARTNNTVGNILGFTGGFATGFGLTHILINSGKKKVNTPYGSFEVKNDNSIAWLVTGIGVGLVGIGIPFSLAANKNADKALMIENANSTAFQPYFKLESGATGLALSYYF